MCFGSCTDLRASVSYPLRRLYGDAYRVAPLSVLVDPVRALRMFEVEHGRAFSPRVRYVYEKQLEEADLIVINKVDLLDASRRAALQDALARRFPQAELLEISARHGLGLDTWFSRVFQSELALTDAPDVDYDIYADGEARLGWLNATIAATHAEGADGNLLLQSFASALQRQLAAEDIEIAHCKMTLTPLELGDEIAALNVVRTDAPAELSHRLSDPTGAGELLLNLRAEAAPDRLQAAVAAALDEMRQAGGWHLPIRHLEAFSPPRPTPTHRMATA
jgi:G3E family GTPase